MGDTIEIRNAEHDEIAAVLNMVSTIAGETYGHLFAADTPVPIDITAFRLQYRAPSGQSMTVKQAYDADFESLTH